MKIPLKPFVLLTILVSAFCGLSYLLTQQALRQSANDPQIQLAQDIVTQIETEKRVRTVLSTPAIDMNKSLSVFYIIYDAKGATLTSTAQLDGKTPVPPLGVFPYTQSHGQDRFTWMPKAGVREAAILLPYTLPTGSGFVLVGRSLLEIEKREDQLLKLTAGAWAVTMVVSCGTVCIFKEPRRKSRSS